MIFSRSYFVLSFERLRSTLWTSYCRVVAVRCLRVPDVFRSTPPHSSILPGFFFSSGSFPSSLNAWHITAWLGGLYSRTLGQRRAVSIFHHLPIW